MRPFIWLTPIWLLSVLVIVWWMVAPASHRQLPILEYQTPTSRASEYQLPGNKTRLIQSPIFKEDALARGISFEHRQNTGGLSSFVDTLGGGACVFDANADGWMDLFLVGGSGTRRHFGRPAWWASDTANRLFLNHQGHFSDQTTALNIENPSIATMGCAIADLDQDQALDILVFGEGGVGAYQSTANGYRYRALLELDEDTIVTAATLIDVNRDSRMDIYVTTLVKYRPGKNIFEQFSGFAREDVAFQPRHYDASSNVLLINHTDFEFTDETKRFGVGNAQGRSLGATALDLNEDGWLDLLVTNDFGTPNRIFLNQQGAEFIDGVENFQPLALSGSRSVARHPLGLMFTRGDGMHPAALFKVPTELLRYEDSSREAGLGSPLMIAMSNWGAAAGDFNLDGLSDLVIANGRLLPDKDAPLSSSGQPNQLLLGSSPRQFLERPFVDDDQHHSSRGIVTADFDNDGDLDVVVANNNGRFLYYDNQAAQVMNANWISIELEFDETELPLMEVIIDADGMTPSTKQVTLAQGFLSQSDRRMHFAVPESINEVFVEVNLANQPSLKEQLSVNQFYRVSKAQGFQGIDMPPETTDLRFDHLSDNEQQSVAEIVARSRDAEAIEQFWPQSTEEAKTRLLDQLAPDRDGVTARVIQLGLGLNESTAVQLAAVQLAKEAELDWSVDWLLPLLNTTDEVSCSVSNLLIHYFDEEEIAVRRKGIAVKALLKRIDSKAMDSEKVEVQDQGAVCALDALAAAENKRALPMLKEIVGSDANVELRAAAVRALGLLRDTSSVSLFQTEFSASDEPSLLASIGVALSRLGFVDLFDTLNLQKSAQTRLATVTAVADSRDAAAIGQPLLSAIVEAAKTELRDEPTEAAFLMAAAANNDHGFNSVIRNMRTKDGFAYWRWIADQQRKIPDAALRLPVGDLEQLLLLEPQAALSPEQWLTSREIGVDTEILADRLSSMSRSSLSVVMSRLSASAEPDFERWLGVCANSRGAPLEKDMARELLIQATNSPAVLACALFGATTDPRQQMANRIFVREFEKARGGPDPTLRMRLAAFDPFYNVEPQSIAPELRSVYLDREQTIEPELLERWWSDGRSNRALKLKVLSELARLDRVSSMKKLRALL